MHILLNLQDKNIQKEVILFQQEVTHDVILRRAQLKAPRRRENYN